MTPKLESYTADEQKELPYSTLLRLRADAYRRHVAKMTIPDDLQAWASRMAMRYGPKVRIWENELPWLEALMVARYGEEPSLWPPEFTQDDVDRALAWMKNKKVGKAKRQTPHGIEYLDLEGGFAQLKALIAMVLIYVGAHVAQLLATLGVLVAAGVGLATGLLDPIEASITVGVGTALSNFWENELIDHLWRGRSFTAPTTHYFALFTAAPGEAGGGTEVSGGSYARVAVSSAVAEFEGTGGETSATDSAGTGGATQNRNAITFPAPTANWGIASHFGSFDASSSGNLEVYGALNASKTINNGDPAPSFGVGDFDFAIG